MTTRAAAPAAPLSAATLPPAADRSPDPATAPAGSVNPAAVIPATISPAPGLRVAALVNARAGTARQGGLDQLRAELREAFAAAGHTTTCRVAARKALTAAIEEAARDPEVDVLLACGGDGTVSFAAAEAHRHGKILAVLPGGTMNFFARSLGLSSNLAEAVRQVAGGEVRAVDLALFDGRPFVHQFSVGLKVRMVTLRRAYAYRSRLGKIVATFRAAGAALARPLAFAVEIETDAGMQRRRASAVAISNNPFGEGHLPYADRLDGGRLGLYVAEPLSRRDAWRLGLDLLLGRWRANPAITEASARSVRLVFPPGGRRPRHCVVDGELAALPAACEITLAPAGLRVLAPAPAS